MSRSILAAAPAPATTHSQFQIRKWIGVPGVHSVPVKCRYPYSSIGTLYIDRDIIKDVFNFIQYRTLEENYKIFESPWYIYKERQARYPY